MLDTRTETPGRHGPPTRRLRDRWTRLPALLRLVVLVHGLLLVASTVLYPNYRGPDEPLHVDLVAATALGQAVPWPAPGGRRVSLGVGAGGYLGNGRIQVRSVLAASEAPARSERPSYRDRRGSAPSRFPNQLVQHPPLYYYLLAPVLVLLPHWQDQPFDRVVALLRIVSALMLLPLPLLGYALARRVGLTAPVAVAAAAVPLAVPQLYHIGSAVNNDSLLLPLLAGASLVAAGVARGDVRHRTALVLGALVAGGLLTKGFGLFLPLLVGLAYLVAATRVGLRRVLLPLVLAQLTGLAGGWWWLRNKLEYGVLQPDGTKTVQPEQIAHTTWGETGTTWLGQFGPLMNRRFWLDPGATSLPRAAGVLAVAGLVVVLGAVLASVAWGRPARRDGLLLLVPALSLAGIVAAGSWAAWQVALRQAGMQGRYLYGGLVMLGVLVAGGLSFLGRRLPLVVLTLAAGSQAVGLWLVLRIYWLPAGGSLLDAGRNILAWSPWPPLLVLPLLIGLAVAAAATLTRAWTDARADQ